MTKDEFTRLFNYVEERLNTIEEKLDTKASAESVDTLTSSVDAYAKKAEDYMQEMLALSHKVDRLERWIQKVAAKSGVELDY